MVSMRSGFKLAVVLADASLELVPREVAKHPAIEKTAKRRGKRPLSMLLDKSLHYHAMKKLPNQEKRGRPDIVHLCLLEVLESPLCKEGYVQPYIYTIGGLAIRVRGDVRVPKNYNRFVGLMEQLLAFSRVPPQGEPLIEVFGRGLREVVEDFKPDLKVLLSERGKRMNPLELADLLLQRRSMVLVGAFPHGDFSEEVLKEVDEAVSIYEEVLEGFVAASVVMRALEFKLNLYGPKQL
ncbi:MAG: 16S rRNA methyltransferase [Thermoprotei archaeon]|nr:MAG: 16S rRNA methyltransferase [Thermoprotei archaeon]